jgi:hypothetical protein
MKLTKTNLHRNRDDMIDFVRQSDNEFYKAALAEYDTANEVVQLAKAERDAAFDKLAMNVKLCDGEAYAAIALDMDHLDRLEGGKKILYLIKKGKFRTGHTEILKI